MQRSGVHRRALCCRPAWFPTSRPAYKNELNRACSEALPPVSGTVRRAPDRKRLLMLPITGDVPTLELFRPGETINS